MLYALAALAAIVFVAAIVTYNGLVRIRQMVRAAWSDVDVYLKRRAELIPNLVTAVKAYASHEQSVLTAVAEARAEAVKLSGPTAEHAEAESRLAGRLVNVLALAEAYPELKANENFAQLQKELSETERHIASARQYYNACVRDLNVKIEAFPSNILASIGGFKREEFFEIEEAAEREAPPVR